MPNIRYPDCVTSRHSRVWVSRVCRLLRDRYGGAWDFREAVVLAERTWVFYHTDTGFKFKYRLLTTDGVSWDMLNTLFNTSELTRDWQYQPHIRRDEITFDGGLPVDMPPVDMPPEGNAVDIVHSTAELRSVRARLESLLGGSFEYVQRLDNFRRRQDGVSFGFSTVIATDDNELIEMCNAQGGVIASHRSAERRRMVMKPQHIIMRSMNSQDSRLGYAGVLSSEFNWVARGRVAYAITTCSDGNSYVRVACVDGNRLISANNILPDWAFKHVFSSKKKAHAHVNRVRRWLLEHGVPEVIGLSPHEVDTIMAQRQERRSEMSSSRSSYQFNE